MNTLGSLIVGQIQVLATGIFTFLVQDRLSLKHENVFMNLIRSFPFHFMS